VACAGPFTRKILGRKNPELIRMLQEVALDKGRARQAAEVFINSLTDSESSALLVRLAFQRSLDAIFDQTESPLETQFFTSLLFHSLCFHFMGFWIQPNLPNKGASEQLHEYAISAERMLEEYLRWKALPGAEDGQFKRHLNNMGVPLEEAESLETLCEAEFGFGLYYRPRIMLQPHFPAIKVAGKSLRADALVYIPYDPRTRIIIECDGWRFHHDKESFRRDRARDRAFTDAGYIVRRYAGADIHESCFDASYDLVEYIYSTVNCNAAAINAFLHEFRQKRGIREATRK
jgi:hypothetical protein